jgi:hypothetical protein
MRARRELQRLHDPTVVFLGVQLINRVLVRLFEAAWDPTSSGSGVKASRGRIQSTAVFQSPYLVASEVWMVVCYLLHET